jgi:uncharacterized RDD family membrane protein YckC
MLPYLALALVAAFTIVYSTIVSRDEPSARSNRERYLTFWRRFWAACIDSLIIIPIVLVFSLWLDSLEGAIYLLASALVALGVSSYSVVLHWRYGKTIGKMVTRVTVLNDADEKHILLRQSVVRDSPLIAVQVGYLSIDTYYALGNDTSTVSLSVETFLRWFPMLWYLAEFATMLANVKRRAIHDLIAGTVVVKDAQ